MANRKVTFVPKQGFYEVFEKFKKSNPKIEARMELFVGHKSEIPPKRLPASMKDHHLVGALDGFRECHLSADILLFYTHENDVVTMFTIAKHDDMKSKKSSIISNKKFN